MLIYILKFSACLAIFMMFYKLVLEKENMHTFKRFYLLAAIALAIGIPLITFIEYIEPQYALGTFSPTFIEPLISPQIEQIQETNYLSYALWSIYGLGILFFGIKFTLNLNRIHNKIKYNPKRKIKVFTNVLLKDLISPHTFFNYIFLNKSKFESNEIPEEVYVHEQAHATQKHSIDVLVIELLQIVFWFNPLLYITKNAIKLNHEFLADQAVLNDGVATSVYQEILLAFSSSDSYRNAQEHQLANAINYSSIKKRFTVMKTQTSKRSLWLRSLLLLPLLAILLYSFSSTKKVEKDIFSKTSATNHTARSISIKVFNSGTYEVDDIKATKKTFVSVINQLHQDITPEIRNKIINIHVSSETDISDKEVWFIYNSVIDYGFHRIVTNNQEIIREKGNKPFAIKNADYQQKATPKQIAEYNRLAKHYNIQPQNKRVIKLKDVERLEYLYNLMTKVQKESNVSFPNCPPQPPAPITSIKELAKKGAIFYLDNIKISQTRALELENSTEYLIFQAKEIESGQIIVKLTSNQNKLQDIVKHYQNKNKVYETLRNEKTHYVNKSKKEKEKLEKLFSDLGGMYFRMSKANKNKVRRPVSPLKPYAILVKNGKTSYKKWNELTTEDRKFLPPPPPAPPKPKQVIEVKNIPPPPPPPMSLEKLAEEGAIFYYEDKKISSNEAIKIFNANKELNVKVKEYGSKQPVVKISSKDIKLKAEVKSKEKLKKALHKSVNKVTKLHTENKIILINGKTPINKEIALTIEEVINLKLTLKNENILSFKFKVPGQPSASVDGNTLNKKGRLAANKILKGDSVQIFNIKTSDGNKHPYIMIIIKD